MLAVTLRVWHFAGWIPAHDSKSGDVVSGKYWAPRIRVQRSAADRREIRATLRCADDGRLIGLPRVRIAFDKDGWGEAVFGSVDTPQPTPPCGGYALSFDADGDEVSYSLVGDELPLVDHHDIVADHEFVAPPPPPPPPMPLAYSEDFDTWRWQSQELRPVVTFAPSTLTITENQREITVRGVDARALAAILNDRLTYGGSECGCLTDGLALRFTDGAQTVSLTYDTAARYLVLSDGNMRIVSRRGERLLDAFLARIGAHK